MADYQYLDIARDLKSVVNKWQKSYRERTIAEQAKAKGLSEIADALKRMS